MKKTLAFVYLLCCTLTMSAQSKTTNYSGSIKGYNINLGFKTGQLTINNVITGQYDTHLINITPDGKYSIDVPLSRQYEVWISFPFFHGTVYLEPGKTLTQDFDITNTAAVQSLFKGTPAAVNNDFNKVRPILMDFNWDTIYTDIYGLTPAQYKAYFQRIQARKLSMIDSVAQAGAFNKKAYDLAQRDVKYNIAGLLIFYTSTMESSYRWKNKLPYDDRQPLSKTVKPDSSYYDFLKELKYNDPLALASFNYYILINRLMYMEPVYDQARTEGVDYVKELALLKTKDTSDLIIKRNIKTYEDMLAHNVTIPGALERARPVVLKKLLPPSTSMEMDIMYLQSIARNMDVNKDTLSTDSLTTIKANIKNHFLLSDIYDLNNSIKESIKNAKSQKGYAYNQLSTTAATDSIFETILDKYKGKVLFIDFWATWCGPCMEAIKKIAPLKEELASNKNIVFLYISNTSSPEKAYATIMPGIKGEHYRLNQDQFNNLSNTFQIKGIPHYVIVDKRGMIVNKNFSWIEPDQVKQAVTRLESE